MIRMTAGKWTGIQHLSDREGIIAAAAMDQRGSLRNMIKQAGGPDPTAEQMTEFKTIVTEVLTPYATAILLDPEYSLPAIPRRASGIGVLLAYERWGYDDTTPGRMPALLDQWSVRRLVAAGASAIKILLYYDPDDRPAINTVKQAFIERVGAECRGEDVPFFLEPLAYSDAIPDEKGPEFAAVKPDKVRRLMAEFTQPRYGVDVLKVEVPITLRYVAGTRANAGQPEVYSRAAALDHFRAAAAQATLPFIYLSASVPALAFTETLELATEAGVTFAGVLCGRATWQDGVAAYVAGGADGLRAWVESEGVANIQALNRTLAAGARPWWTVYGGQDQIEVVRQPV